MHRTLLLTLAALLLVACGECNTPKDAAWRVLDEDALSSPEAKQRQKAFQARDAMSGQLSKRLMAAMGDGGPAAAIDVCRSAAPAVQAQVSTVHGLRIGRTSHRLRNARSVPPAWAAEYVEKKAAENVLLAAPDGRMAALLPISLQQACLGCHGDPETLAAPVRDALAAHYPEDQATGFAVGDLRGWFWVEVPKAE